MAAKRNDSEGSGVSGSAANSALLTAILESASQAILTVDQEGRIETANTRTAEMFGYSQEELIGHPVEILLPEAVRQVHVGHRSGYFAAPRVRPMGVGLDLSARRKDGSEFAVEISLSYVRVGRKPLAIAFISDISARKSLQEQLLHSQKMEAVGRLAGGIAHDFNNLLMIITGYDRLLLNRLSTVDPLRGYSEEIMRAAERAVALTKQLLAFSRRQIIQPKVMNINAALEASKQMYSRLLGEDIELLLRMGPQTGQVRADATQLEQVVLNLLVNARDAMPAGGTILLETANAELDEEYARTHLGVTPGHYVMIAVTDHGNGMDGETQKRIFEPFFTTKPLNKGTGLGLATVYGIVKQNGGDVWVYSEVNRGTIFKVYWPRVDVDSETMDTRSPDWTERQHGTETILVVEDESGVRQLLCQVLRSVGYEVLEAVDSLEAAQVSERHRGPIHLLLTDIVMPRTSGVELAARLAHTRPQMKVLYMSGYTENTIVHHGVLESDVNFIPKPFTFEALLAKVRDAIEG